MKKFVMLVALNLIFVLLQTAFFPELVGQVWTPNLFVAFGLALALLNYEEDSLLSGVIGGVLYDLLTLSTIGFSSFVLSLLLVFLFYVKQHVFKSLYLSFILGFFLLIAYLFITTGFNTVFGLIVSSGVSSFVFTYICYWLLKKVWYENSPF